jgi:hypothetical protein
MKNRLNYWVLLVLAMAVLFAAVPLRSARAADAGVNHVVINNKTGGVATLRLFNLATNQSIIYTLVPGVQVVDIPAGARYDLFVFDANNALVTSQRNYSFANRLQIQIGYDNEDNFSAEKFVFEFDT